MMCWLLPVTLKVHSREADWPSLPGPGGKCIPKAWPHPAYTGSGGLPRPKAYWGRSKPLYLWHENITLHCHWWEWAYIFCNGIVVRMPFIRHWPDLQGESLNQEPRDPLPHVPYPGRIKGCWHGEMMQVYTNVKLAFITWSSFSSSNTNLLTVLITNGC